MRTRPWLWAFILILLAVLIGVVTHRPTNWSSPPNQSPVVADQSNPQPLGQKSVQPLPNKERTDDRYELLIKLQGILRTLGYAGVIVLIDRVDEPHVINGSAERSSRVYLLWLSSTSKTLVLR